MTGTVAQTRGFVNFIAKLPHKHKIVIAGNHDVTLDAEFYAGLSDRCVCVGARSMYFFVFYTCV